MKATCGAMTRRGTPCQRKLLGRGGRCPNHGGCSTGPRTPEGRAKALQALLDAHADPVKAETIRARLRALWRDPAYRLRVLAGRARAQTEREWQQVVVSQFNPTALDKYLMRQGRRRERLDALRAASISV